MAPRERRRITGREIAMVFQEPMTSLNPRHAGRRPDRRDDPFPREGRTACGDGTRGRRLLAAVADARSGGAAPRLAPSALGRTAPAGDDRHRARLPAEAADRGRADHRARRDGAGADPGAARRASARDGHGDAVHHPRPGCRRQHRRPGRGHVLRPDRRGPDRCATSSAGRRIPTPAVCWSVSPAARGPARSSSPFPASFPAPWRDACAVPLRTEVPARGRALPGAFRRRRRSSARAACGPLPPSGGWRSMMNGEKSTGAPLREADAVTAGYRLPSYPQRSSPSGMWPSAVTRGMAVDDKR